MKRRVSDLLLLTESPGSWKGAQKNHRRWPWSFAPNVSKTLGCDGFTRYRD